MATDESEYSISFDVLAALALVSSLGDDSSATAAFDAASATSYAITMDVLSVLEQLQYDDDHDFDDIFTSTKLESDRDSSSEEKVADVALAIEVSPPPPASAKKRPAKFRDATGYKARGPIDLGPDSDSEEDFDEEKEQEAVADATVSLDVKKAIIYSLADTIADDRSSVASSVDSYVSFDDSGGDTDIDGEDMYAIDAAADLDPADLEAGLPGVRPLLGRMNTEEFELTKHVLQRVGTTRNVNDLGELSKYTVSDDTLEVKKMTGLKSHLLVSKGLDFSKVLQERRSTEVRLLEAQEKQAALPVLEGFVTKRAGTKRMGVWKKRWLLVKRGYILWAKKPICIENPSVIEERKRFLNWVPLLRVRKALKVDSTNGRKFNIITSKRVIRLRAPSRSKRDEWVHGINDNLRVMALSLRILDGLSHLAPSLCEDSAAAEH